MSSFFNDKNTWKVVTAERAALLIDGAAYFGAVREALLNARSTVFILGWDVHSRMRLVGETGRARDGYPEELAPFLAKLASERPDLNIYLLLWDFALLYAGEREWLPKLRLDWATPPNVHFRLDDAVPVAASQHQKLVVVDDRVAFSGGLDLTIRRWDTPDHDRRNRQRVDPSGYKYEPFHDVQIAVDGEAARTLSKIARERWKLVTGDNLPIPNSDEDPWPASAEPRFRDVMVGVARTRPAFREEKEVREIEQQYLDLVRSAESCVYVENQFLTYVPFAEALAAQLRRKSKLEAVIVAPHGAESWIEAHTMKRGRARFIRTLEKAGAAERVRIYCPSIGRGKKCVYPMIHSKVTIVDDKLMRVGSANLNFRSMGTDAECDLTIESHGRESAAAIETARNTLLAEHCKTTPARFAAELKRRGSIVAAVDHFAKRKGCLKPIEAGDLEEAGYDRYLEALADPERPISYDSMVAMFSIRERRRVRLTLIALGISVVTVGALAAVWYFTPLADLADPGEIRAQLSAAGPVWGPLLVVAAFLLGSAVGFPINVLTIGVAAAFGPWLGALYSGVGCMASAAAAFAVGRWLGASTLQDALGARLNRIRERVVERGIIAVAAIRLVPVAPFTVVNLAAGAAKIRLGDYLMGTLLGLAPGLAVMSFLGDRATELFMKPTATNIALVVAAAAAWIAVAAGAQYLVSRYWKKPA